MKGGVTAIGIGLVLVVVWMWGAQTEMPAPEAPATARVEPTNSDGPIRDRPIRGDKPSGLSIVPSSPKAADKPKGLSPLPAIEKPEHPSPPISGQATPALEPPAVVNLSPAAAKTPDSVAEAAPLVKTELMASMPPAASIPDAPEPPRGPALPTVAVSSPAAAPSGGDEAAANAKEIVAIRSVLDRYKRMYDQLDASAAPSIWPSVDSRALTRMFSRLDQQTLEFEGCVFALWENGAAADCTGWLSYVPRVGTARREPHAWTIELTRGDEGWRILKVIAR